MSFDPYYEWFRISRKGRTDDGPPDHYTLLGLRRYESDLGRIHEAALNRMKLLRQRQTGARADLTQRLMNEVSQARLSLTDPSRKGQYDFELEQRVPRHAETGEASSSGAPIWLVLAASLLIVGGGTATYFAVMNSGGRSTTTADSPTDVNAKPETPKEAVPETPNPKPADTVSTAGPKKADSTPPTKTPPASKPKQKTASKPALVKMRELPKSNEKEMSGEGDVVHLASIATDADEEDPTFLDHQGLLLGFQRKNGPKMQFVAAERSAPDEAFTTEHVVQGLPEGVRLQGLVIEPGELSCIFATADGKGLLQAKRPDKVTAWSEAAVLAADGGPVKAAWPTLTADGKELFCVQQRSGKLRVLVLKRPSPEAPFSEPKELALGNSFSQAAVSPDGQMLVLRGPEELYVSKRDKDDAWTSPEPVLALRASAGANRALIESPCFSPDGKWLYFASNRDGGVGGFDLWAAPATMLKIETPDLSKMADKGPPKKKPTTGKKESTSDKSKNKSAKGSDKSKKAPPPVAVSSDAPVKDAITEWLVLGPFPDATSESVKAVSDLKPFEGVELLRRMPKENLKAHDGLAWKRTTRFESKGVYSVAVWLRLKAGADVKVIVDSAPGGGMLWFNSEQSEVSWRISDPWSPLEGARKGEPVSLLAGRHRLVGTVCVADPSKPLIVRVVNADDETIPEGMSAGF